MKKKSKRTHRSSGDKYYIPYLPDEIFNNLSSDEREIQREYRVYHRVVHDINKRITDNQLLIKKLRERIKEDKYRLNEKASEEHEEGYIEMMAERYQLLNHLYEEVDFTVSLSPKNRSSESFYKNQKDIEIYGEINDDKRENRRTTYGGKEITEVFSWNAQIRSKNYKYSLIPDLTNNKKIKNITLGTESVMRENLNIMYEGLDFSEDSIDDIKEEWKSIVRAYSTMYISKHKWRGFKLDTHPKEKIVEWCIKNGINEDGESEFLKWLSMSGY